ncbi:hypothetical protein DU57_00820 [Methanosarcina mazei]|nr:hypothetical protein DU47_06220 [Methanosarcina mazei]KKG14010.1 hypothetical protein DU34_11060 [Methanosarcina mazei]KKG32877.1 hypothetical protein DU49_01805 [Methanosarcina mazei]KKG39204.1 hypothetical protein DU39_01610 [Methanosarcina mazei]KKG48456.1 hypothetical protein DU41_12995 [Methanosarcina mazei]
MDIEQAIKNIVSIDIFEEAKLKENFAGRPFYIDYEMLHMLVADSWKMKIKGLPHGSFLLAFYENEVSVHEALLLRVLKPVKLPTDVGVISSMVEYYKDNLKTSGKDNKLDDFTRYEFSFSGLECRILGTFYKDKNNSICFGADVENFYSANNYSVYKAREKVLELIVNFRDGHIIPGNGTDERIGFVRYSSSRRFQEDEKEVPVYVSPKDFLGKRTALFGMTRTGKSNTVKKIVQITQKIGNKAKYTHFSESDNDTESFVEDGVPKYPVGQIIFDINGEYANANMQDQGTAIFELYKGKVDRYSLMERNGEDFKIMKVNFYTDVLGGFELIKSSLRDDTSDYVNSFKMVDLIPPENEHDYSDKIRYGRKKAAYLCCLFSAGLIPPTNYKVYFEGNDNLNKLVQEDGKINPKNGITLKEATSWFTTIWEQSNSEFFEDYKKKKGHDWIDEDLKALLIFLTKKKNPTGRQNISGYLKLRKMKDLHTATNEKPFEEEIIEALAQGKIIIIDLSQGDPEIQKLYSERICSKIFNHSMGNFTRNKPNNFVQFYFEEAHNLFPKKEDKDMSDIYNRIAKEGAKLNLGLIYATQEVSSISSNILKNTQNWFIAHLNNEDEIKEIKKYYDFKDFTENLILFNATSDKGFIRMKTYSNSFVVPVHIDRFLADEIDLEELR